MLGTQPEVLDKKVNSLEAADESQKSWRLKCLKVAKKLLFFSKSCRKVAEFPKSCRKVA